MVPDPGPTKYGPTNENPPPRDFWAGMDLESVNHVLLALDAFGQHGPGYFWFFLCSLSAGTQYLF